MSIFGEPRLRFLFTAEIERPIDFEGDPTSVIPAATLGNVISLTNELVRDTWNYAIWYTNDERFREIRRLESNGIITSRDIELVVVAVNSGSIEVIFDWAIAIYASSTLLQSLSSNISANALWDLVKYAFQASWDLIRGRKESLPVPHPLPNEIMTTFVELVKSTIISQPGAQGKINIDINYSDGHQQFSFKIDQEARDSIIEANQVDISLFSRLIGEIVGLDFYERMVNIRWEQFPRQPIWCDADGLDLTQLENYLPKDSQRPSKKVGFDVELGWRRGVQRVFPPDSIRIVQIVPDNKLNNSGFSNKTGLRRLPISEVPLALDETEIKFLKWFAWADDNWTNSNLGGITGYIAGNKKVLGKRLEHAEAEELIRNFVQRGIIVRTRETRRQDPSNQTLRLNWSHPIVAKYFNERI